MRAPSSSDVCGGVDSGGCDHFRDEHAPRGGRCTYRERTDDAGWDYCPCQAFEEPPAPDGEVS